MSKNNVFQGADVAPGSELYELLEKFEKTGHPDDLKKAVEHYRAVHQRFVQATQAPGLPIDYVSTRWRIGNSWEARRAK